MDGDCAKESWGGAGWEIEEGRREAGEAQDWTCLGAGGR